jgi:TM2 domain-containing membrane protein YozV
MICPYCRTQVDEGPDAMMCQGCNTPHHQECYTENGGCTLFGCKFAPPDEPKVAVTPGEAAVFGAPQVPQFPQFTPVPQRPATGFGDVSQAWRLTPPAATTAPQRSGAVPPPPPITANRVSAPPAPAQAPPANSNGSSRTGERPGYVTPGGIFDAPAKGSRGQRSRLAYILLGIFLGAFGAHNFYARYYKRAILQLCLTVLTFFYGSIVTWIWALAEVCTVDRDADKVAFV